MINKNQIINDMCYTMRHDYGLDRPEGDPYSVIGSGMTNQARRALFNQMAQLYEHHIQPLVDINRGYEKWH